jgi:hypothetical protein
LHGMPLAYALVTLAVIATWFLLPRGSATLAGDESENESENESGNDSLRRMK